MPIGLPVFKTPTSGATAATTTKITNLSMPSANTEYSHSFTNNLKQFIIRSRKSAVVKIAFTNGESGTKYVTLPRGTNLCLEGLDFSSTTLYVQSDEATNTLEIIELY